MMEPEFYLTRATPEDAAFAAAVIVKTAEGMLEYALSTAAAMLGISSAEELISLALLQGDSALCLDNIQLLKVRYMRSEPEGEESSSAGAGEDGECVEEIAGLCLAYPLEHNAGLLPDIALDMLPAEAVNLFRQVLPSQMPAADLLPGGESGGKENSTAPSSEASASAAEAAAAARVGFQDRCTAARRAVCDHAMYLNTLWVSDNWRGLHLGSLLISELKEQSRDFGCGEIVLHCFDDNTRAEAFYLAQGFERFASCSYPADFARRHRGGSLWRCSTAEAEV